MATAACTNCSTMSDAIHLECQSGIVMKYLDDVKTQNEQYKQQILIMDNHVRQLRAAAQQHETEHQRSAVKYQELAQELNMEKERREQADKTADNLWAAVERASGFLEFVWAVCGEGVERKTKSDPTDLITMDGEGRCHAIDEARAILEAYRFEATMHETRLENRVHPLLQAKNEQIAELEGLLAFRSNNSSQGRAGSQDSGHRARRRDRQRGRRNFGRREPSIASTTERSKHGEC